MTSRFLRFVVPFVAFVPLAVFACSSGGSSSSSSSSSGGSSGGSSGSNGAAPTVEKPWSGEKIDIRSDGANVTVNGGISITADPSATKVVVTADIRPNNPLDGGPPDDGPTATLTAEEEGGTIVIRCTKTASAKDGGCNKLTVTVPAGTAAQPLALSVTNGGGGAVSFSGPTAVTSALTVETPDDIVLNVGASKGTEISATSEQSGDITLRLPDDFAADSITLTADADKIDTSAFPDVQSGQGRGTAGSGAKSITLVSKEFAGSTGAIVLEKN